MVSILLSNSTLYRYTEASRRDGKFKEGKAVSADDNASAAVEAQAAAATLGGLTHMSSLPPHIIATASPLRASSSDDDVAEGASAAHTAGAVKIIGVSLSSQQQLAALIGSLTVLAAAAFFVARRSRRRASDDDDIVSINTPLLSGASQTYGGIN
jgi:hypothetical protein